MAKGLGDAGDDEFGTGTCCIAHEVHNVEGHSSEDDGLEGFRSKLLPEALPGLMVHEDEETIGWLGRATFVDACISGPLGWQPGILGGRNGKSRIYKCSMTHNRHLCAALYSEEEYEALVLEAHWSAKSTIRNSNKRFGFSCIHCHLEFKDKNSVSYHRLTNSCEVWNGPGVLKMYPTWLPSDNSELKRIGNKYSKDTYQSDKRGACSDNERPIKRQASVSKSIVCVPHTGKRSGASKNRLVADFDSNYKIVGAGLGFALHIPAQKLITEKFGVKRPATNTAMCPAGSAKPLGSRVAVGNPDSFMVKWKPTREEVQVHAIQEANAFTLENHLKLCSPPQQVPMHGLYVIITETKKEWMPKKLVEQPAQCMQHLLQLKEEGTLVVTVSNAFGAWYLFDNIAAKRNEEDHEKLVSAIRSELKGLLLHETPVADVYRELKRLKNYLAYRISLSLYNAAREAAVTELELIRAAHVQDALRKFDADQKEHAEHEAWGWSPLFKLFKQWPIHNGPTAPWEHTECEWSMISTLLLGNAESSEVSLHKECPHIVRLSSCW